MNTKNLDIYVTSPNEKKPVIFEGQDRESRRFTDYVAQLEHVVVFSPHLDDAVLSAGSLITYLTHKKCKVDVITLFTAGSDKKSPNTESLVGNAGFESAEEYFEARRKEDLVALKELGINETQHMGYTDSAWRTFESGDSIYPETQLTALHEYDSALFKQLLEKCKTVGNISEKTGVFAPMARGKHVDHQLTRNMAATLFPQTIFYQDFPYSDLYGNEDEFITEHDLIGIEWKGDYEAKKKAIVDYVTQHHSLFKRGPLTLPFEKYYVKS